MKTENLLIEPTRKHSRKDLFLIIVIGILFFVSAELLFPILRPTRSYSLPFSNGFFLGISILMVIYVLSRRVYQSIELNHEKKLLKINYITFLKNDCQVAIPFEKLEYEYKIKPSRTGGKWVLRFWNENKRVFSIAAGDFGFEKEKLDLIVEKVKELE